MRSFDWKKTTLLGFVAAALATGCSAEPGAADGFDPVAAPESDIGTSQGRISQIGGVATNAGTSTALFDVMASINNLDYIAVNAAEMAAQNVQVSVYSVDQTGAISLLQQKSLTSSAASGQSLDQAATDLIQNQSTVVAQSASSMKQGSSASRYQATSASAVESVASQASDVSQVAAEQHSAAATQRAADAAAQRQSAAYAASADQANSAAATSKDAAAASQYANQFANVAQTVSSLPVAFGGLSSGFGIGVAAPLGFSSAFDTAAANAAQAAESADVSSVQAADAASVDQAAASDVAAHSSNVAAAQSLDAVASRTAAHQATAASEHYAAQKAESIATADQVSFAEQNAIATRDASATALHQTSLMSNAASFATLDQAATEALQQQQMASSNSAMFNELQSAKTNHFLVQVSWDAAAQAQSQHAAQTASAFDSQSAFQSVFPTISLWGGLVGGGTFGRSFCPFL